MILYNTRKQKLPLSIDFYTKNANALKMFRYNETLMSNCGDYKIQEQVTSDDYYTYNALVTFNNTLDKNVINAFISLDKFLQGHEVIESTCDHILRKIVKKYNLDPICFHELRHTCASLLINFGVIRSLRYINYYGNIHTCF